MLSADPSDPDIAQFRTQGWQIRHPSVISTPEQYQGYVLDAGGEFSCTKGGYAGTRCGWFSDRSACFLAAGRPVVLQSTGFEDVLPTGEGLFAFKTLEEAVDAIHAIRRDYERHARAAQRVARDHLDASRIAHQLLGALGSLS